MTSSIFTNLLLNQDWDEKYYLIMMEFILSVCLLVRYTFFQFSTDFLQFFYDDNAVQGRVLPHYLNSSKMSRKKISSWKTITGRKQFGTGRVEKAIFLYFSDCSIEEVSRRKKAVKRGIRSSWRIAFDQFKLKSCIIYKITRQQQFKHLGQKHK